MELLLQSEPGSAVRFWSNPPQWLRDKRLSREFWIFFTVAFFFDAGFSVYFFLFNLYLLDLHFTERTIGLAGGSLTLGSLAGMLPAGMLARKIGLRPLLVFCILAAPLAGVLRAQLTWPPAQIALAFLAGVAMCSWGVCFLPAIARLTTEQNRPSAFSLIFSVSIGTSALGGVVCGYLPRWLRMTGLAVEAVEVKRLILQGSCAIAALALLPLLRLRLPPQPDLPKFDPSQFDPSQFEREETSLAAPLRGMGWLRKVRIEPFLLRFLPLMALWAAVLAAFTPFSYIYLSRDLHIPLTRIGLIFSAAQVVQLLMGMLTPLVFRLMGLVNGIVMTQVVTALALGVMTVAGGGRIAIALYLTFSAAQWMSTPGLYNLLMNQTPDRERSTAAATTLFCNALVGSAATAVAGSLFTRFGYPQILTGIAIAALVSAGLFKLLLGRVGPPQARD